MERTRFYCNICKNETWHEVTSEYEQDYYDYIWGYTKKLQGQILKCCGCDYLSFRLYEHPFDFEDNGQIEESTFPTREHKKRQTKIFRTLPIGIQKIYRQTNAAFDNELYLLAGIGLRAMLEAIVTDRLPATEYSSSVHSKIEALRKHFSEDVINTLHEFRFVGNRAVHSLEEPKRLEIHMALNVLEAIMTFFYNIEESARSFQMLRQ